MPIIFYKKFFFFIASLFFASSAQAQDWTLEKLLDGLSKVKEMSGEFTEHRRSLLLTEDIVLHGTISYSVPDKLEKITVEPVKEKLRVKGDKISLSKKGEIPKRFSLTSDPAIAGAAAGIRATLQGDGEQLHKYYRVNLWGEKAEWLLHLLPLEPGLREYIEEIKIHGRDEFITRVELTDAEGDETDISFTWQEPENS